jgi:hypothetical protein
MNNATTNECYDDESNNTQQPLSDQFRNLCVLFALDAAAPNVEQLALDFTANVAARLHAAHTSRLQLLVCHDWQVGRLAGIHYYLTSFGFGLTLKQINSGDYVVGIRLLADSKQNAMVNA